MTTTTKKNIVCTVSGLTATSGVAYTGGFATELLASLHRCIPGPWGQIGALAIEITGFTASYLGGIKAGEATADFVAALIDNEWWLENITEK